MALSKVFASSDRTRFARLALIIVEELTPILRDVLGKEISPSVIFNRVKANIPLFKIIRKDQLLLIQNAHTDGYRDFDITLLYTLIRNLCSNIPSPTQGWGISNMPSVSETSVGDDIERIRLIKNKFVSHVSTTCISQTEFSGYWAVIYGLCQRMGNYLHKYYIPSLQIAQYRPFNEELENEWMVKIQDSSESEKKVLEVIRELAASVRGMFSASAKVDAQAKDPAKKEQADFLLETTIDLLNHMVDCINEVTTEEELKEIFDTVESLLKEGSNEIIRDSIKPFFDKLTSKIKTYANQQVRKISILAKFTKFVIYLRTKYGADIKSCHSSLLINLTFFSKEGYELYGNDLERGEIGKEILDLLLYPVYLACFDLKANDLIISLNNQTIYDDPGEREDLGLRRQRNTKRRFPTTDFSKIIDPQTRAQEILQCVNCSSFEVEVLCALCDVILCRTCIGTHVLSDVTRCHTFVGFYLRSEEAIFPRCPSHQKKTCELHCKKCNLPVCIECTISEKHEYHTFLNIFDIFKKKQSRFKSDLEKLKKDFDKKYKILLSDVEKQESELETDLKNLRTDISNQKRKWYNAIERHFNNLNSEIAQLENKHRDEMKRCKAKINQNIQKVEENLEQINGILKSNNISKSLKFQTDLETLTEMEIIPQVKICLPTFSPLRVPEELISMWFGSLRFDADNITPKNIKQILPQPRIIASVGTQYTSNLYNVVGYTDRQIWTSGDDCSIKVFHSDQKALLKTFRTLSGHRPESIAIISTGHLVYTDYHERSVNIVKDEENYHVIRLENWIPHGVCKTCFGHFLVIMISTDYKQSKVVRYLYFKEKQTIFAYRGIPLLSSGDFYRYITENRNLDICVSDHGAGAVVVVNQAGELRFRYTGLTPDPKNKPFDPRGITTDSQSHILIADIENHCVHVIDQNGQFLRYVECGLSFPWGLCTDENDLLLVAQYRNRKIDIISYMQ